jgi:hydrophobe/amphiphile efflux-1 (HAE1) family protein
VNLSAPFIRRPIGTSLLAAALLVAGVAAFTQLAVAPLPQLDLPTINISASYPGASPTTMATAVAMPLERRFGRIAGVSEITSQSALGTTSITVQFDLDRNVESAARDIQAAINAAGGDLPAELPAQPTYRKVNPSDAPILVIALRSDTIPLPRVFQLANTILAPRIAQVPGVGQVGVGGGVQPAVRVEVDPLRLAALGIGLEQIRSRIGAASVAQPTGGVGAARWSSIRVDDQLATAAQWRDMIITSAASGAVRLGDVATVVDDVENRRIAGWYDGERTVTVIIRRQPGANILDVIDRVKQLLPSLSRDFSPAIRTDIAIDRSTTIRASVHDVERSLGISMVLVVVVVFAFLRSLRATAVPAIAVPLSLVGTFGVMYVLGYSLDNLSLMALTIATGFVVDDAIVVTENVTRHLEAGESPTQAALTGARQVGFTIVSMTASLIAVFIPLLFMGGIVGRLFRELVMTLTIAILLSAVLSLTLTPMMCARLLTPPRTRRTVFDVLADGYGRILRGVLRHGRLVGVVSLITAAATVGLYLRMPKGLLPQQDTGMILGTTRGPQDISFSAMRDREQQIDAIVRRDRDVEHVVSSIGGFGSSTGNTGTMFISLRERSQRTSSADAVIARLRHEAQAVQGISLFMQSVQDVRIGGRPTSTQFQYTLRDADARELATWVPQLSAALSHVTAIADVTTDQQNAGRELDLAIDRDTAARYGITASAIDNALYDAFGQRQVATYFTQVDQYHVVLEVATTANDAPDALAHLYVTAASGAQVPLTELVHVTTSAVPLLVTHQGQFPSATISFNLASGASLGVAIASIDRAALALGMPARIHGSFAGTAQSFQASLVSQKYLVTIAIIVVFIVLGVLYESYVHPLTILSTLPAAGLGALVALDLCGHALDLIAMVGLILLIGIVKKNAILMIDFALDEEHRGATPVDAIYRACLLRFRPILMTTLCALLGALPLAIGTGTGSELRRPLGIAIVGGLVVSQLLTLFTTPVTYLALHRLTRVNSTRVSR